MEFPLVLVRHKPIPFLGHQFRCCVLRPRRGRPQEGRWPRFSRKPNDLWRPAYGSTHGTFHIGSILSSITAIIKHRQLIDVWASLGRRLSPVMVAVLSDQWLI